MVSGCGATAGAGSGAALVARTSEVESWLAGGPGGGGSGSAPVEDGWAALILVRALGFRGGGIYRGIESVGINVVRDVIRDVVGIAVVAVMMMPGAGSRRELLRGVEIHGASGSHGGDAGWDAVEAGVPAEAEGGHRGRDAVGLGRGGGGNEYGDQHNENGRPVPHSWMIAQAGRHGMPPSRLDVTGGRFVLWKSGWG